MIERQILPQGTKPDMEKVLNGIMDSALSNPLILEREPTTTNGDLKESQLGYFSNALYLVINSTTYKIALTAV